jgi:large subunit ribosomal protein L1
MASKRYVQGLKLVDRNKAYELSAAVGLLKQLPPVKFDEGVELSVSLGIDPKKTDQAVRGTVTLPHGTGKTRRVVVFCKGEQELAAKQAGAEFVGAAELIDKIQQGWMDFDVAIATPDMMKDVSRLGKILGPRGLMPNPKAGTVSADVAKAVTEVKGGRVEFKMDKLANLHVGVGKLSFAADRLVENTRSVIEAVMRSKPAALKGQYIRRAVISSTMSPGVPVDIAPFVEQQQA